MTTAGPRSKTIEQTTSLLANNADLKAQIQEKVFAIAALKNDLRKLKGNNNENAFKSERAQMSKQRFASQVDVNKNLSKPVTQHYLPKKIESAFAKPDHVIASSSSRNSSKNTPRFSSNDMVHNHYLDEARKKTQERDRNSKTSVMPSARFQNTTDGSKPKPRSNNQTSRSLPVDFPYKKLFDSYTTRFDSERPTCSNGNIPNIQECRQIMDSMAAEKADISETIVKVDSQMMIQKNDPRTTVSTEVHQAAETVTTSKELDLLFGPLFDEYFNGENQVVLKSSAVTTTDASNKRQQPDSTSSTSTLATTVTTNGNFDL
ncbi:hypothetical protein Tco_0648227 [Tanacetum coccineum]